MYICMHVWMSVGMSVCYVCVYVYVALNRLQSLTLSPLFPCASFWSRSSLSSPGALLWLRAERADVACRVQRPRRGEGNLAEVQGGAFSLNRGRRDCPALLYRLVLRASRVWFFRTVCCVGVMRRPFTDGQGRPRCCQTKVEARPRRVTKLLTATQRLVLMCTTLHLDLPMHVPHYAIPRGTIGIVGLFVGLFLEILSHGIAIVMVPWYVHVSSLVRVFPYHWLVGTLHLSACISSRFWDTVTFIYLYTCTYTCTTTVPWYTCSTNITLSQKQLETYLVHVYVRTIVPDVRTIVPEIN
jgi:hypothetical protein